jgi:hypothetical protein
VTASTSPTDTLDACTYTIPAAQLIQKWCFKAAVRYLTLPSEHSLYKLVRASANRKVKTHKAPASPPNANLRTSAIMMPPEEERERLKEYVEGATCPEWWNSFLLADGTKFPLSQKPGLHKEAWFDKNKNYSINCQVRDHLFPFEQLTHAFQIICLPHNLLIVDYSLGHTGSMHDTWAFRSTCTFKDHEKIFAPGIWMWADSAYPPET